MSETVDISIIISTYNRCDMLAVAMEDLLRQCPEGGNSELIIVDNNSTDRTRQVVESFIARGHTALRYVFEPKQGVSHGRNAGIANARGKIIAFTDDDMRVDEGWVASIQRAFTTYPEIEFAGGKILPDKRYKLPSWLTRDHWWPIPLLDCGDLPFYVSAENPLCLPTANACYRRDVFARYGGFSPLFSGREDHEFLLRLWLAGAKGIYFPEMVVTAQVQPERLKKAYHRQWNAVTGKFNAMMNLNDICDVKGRIVGERADVVKLFSVPAFIYHNLFTAFNRWMEMSARGDEARALKYENLMRYFISYIRTRFRQDAARRRHSALTEISTFVKGLVRKKMLNNRLRDEESVD